jgi:hypothetical protein
MSKTLGGFAFITEGVKFDYCFEQSIRSMCECCDKVVIVYANSKKDGTDLILDRMDTELDNLFIYNMPIYMWEDMKGKTKLANFQNIAAMCLDTDYQILCQMDEIIHEESYKSIRDAMDTGGEGFLCERVNLWGDPNHMLVVPQNRQPCSPQVIRLTKRGYWCYDDGESIAAPTSSAFVDKIKIVHYGFVRKREVMKAKIINMQQGVFGMADYDKKLDQCDVFNPYLWFNGDDLAPINFAHPKIMQKWVLDRV